MFKKVFWLIGVLALVISFSGTAMAILATVGPTNPTTTVPAFYDDTNGVSLGFCLDFASGLCLTVPPLVGNAHSQLVGWGDEGFYWSADVIDMPLSDGGNATLIMALEAAWLSLDGLPAPGQETVFGRLRIRVRTGTNNGTNLPATYTITHPYGVETFDAVPPNVLNQNAINFTNDNNNLILPQNFTFALQGPVGPFLRWDPAVPPAAPAGFVGNPAVPHSVIGSPLGTNFFAVAVNGVEVGRTDQFGVSGQIAANRPGPDIGIFRGGRWFQDLAGNGFWEGCADPAVGGVLGPDRCQGPFGGLPQDKPVVGRWVAAQPAKIGIFRDGFFFLDRDGNGLWGGEPADDIKGPFGGLPQDVPIAGRWSLADTSDNIGIYRDGMWFLDADGDGLWNGALDLTRGPFGGAPGDVPVVGDWVGDGITRIGIYRSGSWFLDNGNGTFDGCGLFPAQDRCLGPFGGAPGDIPVTGIWTNVVGDTIHKIGIYRGGKWFLDFDNSGTFTACGAEACVDAFGGAPGDIPITGRWQ